jgi:predicted DCC family thiol-disulfide oxidoreductase YuxK
VVARDLSTSPVKTTATSISVAVVTATPIVVFDGECGFCRCTVSWAKRRLRTDAQFAAWQDIEVEAVGLTVKACQDAVQWVGATGIFGGHRAVALLLQSAQFPWRLIGRLIDVPGLRLVSRVTYAIVKANRSRLVHFCRQSIE